MASLDSDGETSPGAGLVPTGAGDDKSFPSDLPEAEQGSWKELKEIQSTMRGFRERAAVDAGDLANLWSRLTGCVKSLQLVRSALQSPVRTRPPSRAPVGQSPPRNHNGNGTFDPKDLQESTLPAFALLFENESTPADALLESTIPLFFSFWDAAGYTSGDFSKADIPVPQSTPARSPKPKPATLGPPAPLTTIGKDLTKARRQLDEWSLTGVYSLADLAPLKERLERHVTVLADVADSMRADAASGQKHAVRECVLQGVALLEEKAASCSRRITILSAGLSSIHTALLPVFDRLVQLKRELVHLLRTQDPGSWDLAEVSVVQDELRSIDSARVDGKYMDMSGAVVPGQAIVVGLLEECFADAHELLERKDVVEGDNPLRDVYERLIRIRAKLERISLTHRWTLRESELVSVQHELDEIDSTRVDGKFLDRSNPQAVPPGQAILHLVLHKCYRLVQRLTEALEASETDLEHPELQLVHNQLVTLRKCLGELRRWRVRLGERDLLPYQLKLKELDDLREAGVWAASDGTVPPGQAVMTTLLEECYELLETLRSGRGDDQD